MPPQSKLVGLTRWLIILAVGLLVVLAAIASLPLEIGWLSQTRWAARTIVAAGVVIGLAGTIFDKSLADVGQAIDHKLDSAPREVKWACLLLAGALFVGVASLPIGLILSTRPTVAAVTLQQITEVGTGRTTAPSLIRQDSSGAFWFTDDRSRSLGRASSSTTNVKIELPSALTAPDEELTVGDVATFGTSAGVVYHGDVDRVVTFDAGGQLTGLYTVPGAQRVAADPRGHLWVASVSGLSERAVSVTEIDPATHAIHRFGFPPASAGTDYVDVEVDGQGQIWLATSSQQHSHDIGIWTLRNGFVGAFAYRQPRLRYGKFDADFVIDHQGVLWIPVQSDLMAVPSHGAPRLLHLNPIGDLMSLTPARTGGVLALMTSRSEVVDSDDSPDRTYVVAVPSMTAKEFPPYYPLDPGTTDRSVPFGAYGQILSGQQHDFAVSFPARHSVFRFPEGVLVPKQLVSGPLTQEIDRLGRGVLPSPTTRADVDAPTPTVSRDEWRGYLTKDADRAEQALKELPGLTARLPAEAAAATDALRLALEEQENGTRQRIASGKLDTGSYVASFRAKTIGETLIAVNGLRELAGLPRLDFDRQTVWDAARRADTE